MRLIQIQFSQYLRTVGYGKSSQVMMNYALAELLERVDKELLDIDLSDLQSHEQYLSTRPNKRQSGGLSSSMLRHYMYSLKVFFNWCEKTERLPLNPASGLLLPSVDYVPRTILTGEEIQLLYEACESELDRAILGVFYGCGLRRKEGELLNGGDVNYKESVLYVRRGKGGKRRVVPLSKGLKNDLLNYDQKERNGTNQDAFLLSERGSRLRGNQLNKRLKKLVSKAGILKQISLHNLRHSIATHLLESGVDIERVRDFLGHAQLESTQIYLRNDTGKVLKK